MVPRIRLIFGEFSDQRRHLFQLPRPGRQVGFQPSIMSRQVFRAPMSYARVIVGNFCSSSWRFMGGLRGKGLLTVSSPFYEMIPGVICS